jgi:hypothetical protein
VELKVRRSLQVFDHALHAAANAVANNQQQEPPAL